MPISPARSAAFDILMRVEARGAFLDEALHRGPLNRLEPRDRALASEIVIGVLRWQGTLDSLVESAARRKAARLDAEVRIALRMGAYQMRRLEGVIDRAAVFESVEIVKRGPKRSAAGFVNAVLRKLPDWPDEERAHELSHPAWMIARWQERLGKAATWALLAANQLKPDVYLRVDRRRPLEETLRLLSDEGVEVEPTEHPWAFRLLSGRPAETDAWREGRIRIQDLGSQLVVELLGLCPEDSFLDVCAAPGGKTQQAVEIRGSAQGIVACDLHLHRLRRMRELAVDPVGLAAADFSRGAPFTKQFDRVLVDAPCSGTGTLAHNPDIKWKLRPEDIADLQARQIVILRTALELTAPASALVYSTCSLEREENEDVVAAALADRADFRVTASLERTPGRDPGDGFRAFRLERAG